MFVGSLSMASEDDGQRENCTMTWTIDNAIYCWHRKEKGIKSPVFLAETVENTMWALWLYPRGDSNANYIGYYLHREDDSDGVDTIQIDFEIAFLAADGSVLNLNKEKRKIFKKREGWGWDEFLKREDVFTVEKSVYLPKDSLIVRCRIWKSNEKHMETRQFFARTIIQVERQSFEWGLEKFSSLEPDQKNTVIVKSASGVALLTCDLHLTEGLCGEELINIDIVPWDNRMKSLKFQAFLVNSRGSTTDCGGKEFILDALRKEKLTLLLSKKELIKQKSLYLPKEALTLICECAFSIGVASEFFEIIHSGNIPPRTKNEVATNVDVHAKEALSNALLDGFEYLHKNEILCDTKLCTKTETFTVHSVLLSAISPVFRAMFTTDIKEKANECVDIPDVNAETFRQILQYVYTATVEIRDLENATLLYKVANKYDIKSMKNYCSSYFKSNLCSTNALQILVLSDMHGDKDLKKAVQDYILKEGEIIFESNEWMQFMVRNLKLASEIMYQNWIKNGVPKS